MKIAASWWCNMKTFWLTASLGELNLHTLVKSDLVDEIVAHWQGVADKVDPSNQIGATRDFIIDNVLANRHHTNEDIGELVSEAFIWLIAKGKLGPAILPFMRRGEMSVAVEISKVDGPGSFYNFRTTVDEDTAAQMRI
ncbi:hypothetical protein Q2941_43435 [Bradyrhizobium sp. UFLA05-153]